MQEYGAKLAKECQSPCVIFLQGELGAGKTTLVRGFLRALGYKGRVKSPTYTLVEPYNINSHIVYHFDLYRLKDVYELEEIGVREYFHPNSICLIEWPEKGEPLLPQPNVICNIKIKDSAREIELVTEW